MPTLITVLRRHENSLLFSACYCYTVTKNELLDTFTYCFLKAAWRTGQHISMRVFRHLHITRFHPAILLAWPVDFQTLRNKPSGVSGRLAGCGLWMAGSIAINIYSVCAAARVSARRRARPPLKSSPTHSHYNCNTDRLTGPSPSVVL